MKSKSFTLLVLCVSFFTISCKKNKTDTPTPDLTPKITTLSATSGRYGSVLTITGSNFSTNAGNNVVKIGNATIPVQSATATSLTIQIPSLLATGGGAVEVTTNNGKVTGPTFIYLADVFICGSETAINSNSEFAKYWRNDTAVSLNSGTNESSAFSIQVSGNDVIVGGNVYNNVSVPTIWRNGTASALPGVATGSTLNHITVSGNDVYATGYDNTNPFPIAKYWRNSASVALSNGNSSTSGNAITTSGTDVLVAGYSVNNSTINATYWRNNTAVILSNASSSAQAITVSGSDVLVAGHQVISNKSKATVWRNGVSAILTTGNNNEEALAIAIAGNDVHVVGTEYNATTQNNMVKYWKNGVATVLTDGSRYTEVTDIAVYGNDVYITGHESVGNVTQAVYWKNGTRIALPRVSNNSKTHANGICLR
jgi:predicted heme/steroid binding protein